MQKTRDIVLFDMDGTLTPARKPITNKMIRVILKELDPVADWGIVTGSGFDYLMDQCSELLSKVKKENVHLLPCNGTQYWTFDKEDRVWVEHPPKDMRDFVGSVKFNLIVRDLLIKQTKTLDHILIPSDIDISGHFVSYRQSMINWCPIGRDASDDLRQKFFDFDSKTKWRETARKELLETFGHYASDVVVTIGGHTSFDIFPQGWDKTFALSRFPQQKVWFVGDKCTGSGNDRTIFEKLDKAGRGFQTSCPEETIKIIRKHIIPVLSNEST